MRTRYQASQIIFKSILAFWENLFAVNRPKPSQSPPLKLPPFFGKKNFPPNSEPVGRDNWEPLRKALLDYTALRWRSSVSLRELLLRQQAGQRRSRRQRCGIDSTRNSRCQAQRGAHCAPARPRRGAHARRPGVETEVVGLFGTRPGIVLRQALPLHENRAR